MPKKKEEKIGRVARPVVSDVGIEEVSSSALFSTSSHPMMSSSSTRWGDTWATTPSLDVRLASLSAEAVTMTVCFRSGVNRR